MAFHQSSHNGNPADAAPSSFSFSSPCGDANFATYSDYTPSNNMLRSSATNPSLRHKRSISDTSFLRAVASGQNPTSYAPNYQYAQRQQSYTQQQGNGGNGAMYDNSGFHSGGEPRGSYSGGPPTTPSPSGRLPSLSSSGHTTNLSSARSTNSNRSMSGLTTSSSASSLSSMTSIPTPAHTHHQRTFGSSSGSSLHSYDPFGLSINGGHARSVRQRWSTEEFEHLVCVNNRMIRCHGSVEGLVLRHQYDARPTYQDEEVEDEGDEEIVIYT